MGYHHSLPVYDNAPTRPRMPWEAEITPEQQAADRAAQAEKSKVALKEAEARREAEQKTFLEAVVSKEERERQQAAVSRAAEARAIAEKVARAIVDLPTLAGGSVRPAVDRWGEPVAIHTRDGVETMITVTPKGDICREGEPYLCVDVK